MIDFTLQQVVDAIHPLEIRDVDLNRRIAGVTTDSRMIMPGNLFVPIRGERFNGHNYVVASIEEGAAAALWTKGEPFAPEGVPLLVVEDPVKAMQDLSAAYRKSLKDTTFIGVTGSSGKTTTKDIIASVASTGYATQKTQANHNNEIGVPMTILSLRRSTKVAVIEMGIDGPDQMELLSSIVEPDVAVITSISESHIDNFGMLEVTTEEKYKITSHMRKDGLFLYNGDNKYLKEYAAAHPVSRHQLAYGFSGTNNVYTLERKFETGGLYFRTNTLPKELFHLNLLGDYEILNALPAVVIGISLGLSAAEIRKGLESVEITGMREDVRNFGRSILIDGTYNCNPGSLAASLKMLSDYPLTINKIAVLGDMYGLGEQTAKLHRKVGREVDFKDINELWVYGKSAPLIAEEAEKRYPALVIRNFRSKEALAEGLAEKINEKSLILAKASRAVALERVLTQAEAKYGE